MSSDSRQGKDRFLRDMPGKGKERSSFRTFHGVNGKIRILVVEDDPSVRKALYFSFEKVGYRPKTVDSLSGARMLLVDGQFDLVVTDYQLAPGETGLDLLEYLKRKKPDLPVIVISGVDEDDLPDRAVHLGAYAFFRKPFELSLLLESCEAALSTA